MTKVQDTVVKSDNTVEKNTTILDEDICKYSRTHPYIKNSGCFSEFGTCQLMEPCLVHPHTLTALVILLALMFYAATRSNYENTADSIKLGLLAAVACFVFIGMLQFPDGPFVRPSKPIWRAVLSLSVLYQLCLVFLLFLVILLLSFFSSI